MGEAQRTRAGLAARIVRATLTIGLITLLAAGSVAVWSTSRLSVEKAKSRNLVAIQVVEDRLEGRLRSAGNLVSLAAQSAAETGTAGLRGSVRTQQTSNADVIAELVIVDASGGIVAGEALSGTAKRLPDSDALQSALSGSTHFVVDDPGETLPEVWLTRTTLSPDRQLLVVFARIEPALFSEVISQTAEALEGGTVALLESETAILMMGPHGGLNLDTARWTPSGPRSGSVMVTSGDGTRQSGHYDQIQGFEGLDWRVVVCSPAGGAILETLRAVVPSISILTFGGMIALLVAWGLATRMVRPLRELERTARSVAGGSYVKPLAVTDQSEIGRVAEAFNDVALRLNALHDLSQLLASASQLDQVLDGILAAMSHIVGPGSSAVYLLDADEPVLRPVRSKGSALANAQPVNAQTSSWLATALGAIDPQVFPVVDGSLERELPGIAGAQDAVLVAPLIVGNEALGVVVVLVGSETALTEAEREMVRTFSSQAAVAVRNSRLFEIQIESRRVAEALRAVAEALVRPLGLATALQEVETIVREMLQATRVRIAIIDRVALGLPRDPDTEDEHAVLGVGLRVLGTSQVDGPTRVWHGMDARVDELLDEYDAAEMLMVPIAVDGDHGAVMMILMPQVGAGKDVLNTLQALADELELALDNAYFYERALTRAANLETIFRISQVVGSSLQINVVLNRVLDVVQKILQADAVALLMFDTRKKRLTTSMARGQIPPSLLHLEVLPGEDLPGHVLSSGEPVVVQDLHTGMDGVAGAAATSALRSLTAVPLRARSKSIGVLMVFSTEAGAFSEEDMGILQTFAAQAALAIDTADLYGREHEVASVLQRSIIPGALPVFDEVVSGSVYHPAGGDADIGGDYYDIFRSPTGEIWMAMADVCGKGVGAATKTSMIKYTIRALVSAGLDPAAVMSEVNRMTAEAGEPSDIVTLWVGYYDAVSQELVWSNGGHPPGMLRREDGSIVPLAPTGPLLGAIASVVYESERVSMRPGDTVLLYTDGVTEARQGNTFFGEQRVSAVLAEGGEPEVLARRLLSEVSRFASMEMRDDIALLVVTATQSGRQDREDKG